MTKYKYHFEFETVGESGERVRPVETAQMAPVRSLKTAMGVAHNLADTLQAPVWVRKVAMVNVDDMGIELPVLPEREYGFGKLWRD